MEAAKDNDLTVEDIEFESREDLESGEDLKQVRDDEIRVHFHQKGCDSVTRGKVYATPNTCQGTQPRLLSL